jgi:hypothetical protein
MMKRIFVGLAFLLCAVSFNGQKAPMEQQQTVSDPGANFPMTVHVNGIHFRTECWGGGCSELVYADVTSNGRKLEMRINLSEKQYRKTPLLSFGDLRARVKKNVSGMQPGDIYELLLPDNRVLDGRVSGIFE